MQQDSNSDETAEGRFSARLLETRRAAGLSQTELARRVGLDPTAITKIEKRSRSIRLNEAVALANALATTVDELIRPTIDRQAVVRLLGGYMGDLVALGANATTEWEAAEKRLRALLKELERDGEVPAGMAALIATEVDEHGLPVAVRAWLRSRGDSVAVPPVSASADSVTVDYRPLVPSPKSGSREEVRPSGQRPAPA